MPRITTRNHNSNTNQPEMLPAKHAKKFKVTKSYPQSSFRKVIKTKTPLTIANDNTDMLVYLVYIEYLHQLLAGVSEQGMTEHAVDSVHSDLLRRFQG